MTSSVPVVRPPVRYVWLVWQRAWTGQANDRHFAPRLLMVCSSLETAFGAMVSDDTSTWTQQVALDAPFEAAASGD